MGHRHGIWRRENLKLQVLFAVPFITMLLRHKTALLWHITLLIQHITAVLHYMTTLLQSFNYLIKGLCLGILNVLLKYEDRNIRRRRKFPPSIMGAKVTGTHNVHSQWQKKPLDWVEMCLQNHSNFCNGDMKSVAPYPHPLAVQEGGGKSILETF